MSDDNPTPPPEPPPTLANGERLILPAKRPGVVTRLRNYLVAGIVVTAPIGITLWLLWAFVNFVDKKVLPLVPPEYNPETYLPFSIPGIGLVIVLVVLTFIGWTFSGFLGRLYVRLGERILERVPVVRHIYGALKQVFEAVLAQKSGAFREVVLVEYPHTGVWIIGFVTSTSMGEIQNRFEETTVNVFVPTTPNPTSGFLLFVPREDLVPLDMTIEEGLKLVISGGIVTPPDRRPAAEQRRNLRTIYGGKSIAREGPLPGTGGDAA